MNNKLKLLIVAALSFSINPKSASSYTNKTVMAPAQQSLIDLHWLTTAIKGSGSTNLKNKLGAIPSVLWFYGKNTNNAETGKYFGFNNKNVITLGTDIPASKIITGSTSTATIKFSPTILDYGVTIAWYQSLSQIYKGLNSIAILPIDHKEQNIRLSSTDPSIINYFQGGATPGQDALKNAKIIGKHSTTDLSGLYVDLADSRFWAKNIVKTRIKLAIIIPTGQYGKVPIIFGAGVRLRNWIFGTGISTESLIWGNKEHNIKGIASLSYYYLTGITSNRTLGLKDVNWGPYQLAVVPGQTNPAPAANLITTDVKSDANWIFGFILGLTYNKSAFSADAGYNFFCSGQESIKLKNPLTAPTLLGAQSPSVIDIKAAQLEAQMTHNIYAILSYSFKEWDSPIALSLGGQYVFAEKNSAVDFCQIWIKGGIFF